MRVNPLSLWERAGVRELSTKFSPIALLFKYQHIITTAGFVF